MLSQPVLAFVSLPQTIDQQRKGTREPEAKNKPPLSPIAEKPTGDTGNIKDKKMWIDIPVLMTGPLLTAEAKRVAGPIKRFILALASKEEEEKDVDPVVLGESLWRSC